MKATTTTTSGATSSASTSTSTSGTSTSSTSTSSTSTSTGTTAGGNSFMAPVYLQAAGNKLNVSGAGLVLPSGMMLAKNGSQFYQLSSDTANPIAISVTPTIAAINASGQGVGYDFLGAYWSSLTASPTGLPGESTLFDSGYQTDLVAINSTGAIAGYTSASNGQGGFVFGGINYWSSPTAQPNMITGLGDPTLGGTITGTVLLTDDGYICSGATLMVGQANGPYISMVPAGATASAMSVVNVCPNDTFVGGAVLGSPGPAYVWKGPSFTPKALPMGAFTSLSAFYEGSNGSIVGIAWGAGICYWSSESATPVLFSSLYPTSSASLGFPIIILNDGSILIQNNLNNATYIFKPSGV